MENEKKKRTAVTVTESRQVKALKIAKKKGINKFSTLIDVLLADYINRNLEFLEKSRA